MAAPPDFGTKSSAPVDIHKHCCRRHGDGCKNCDAIANRPVAPFEELAPGAKAKITKIAPEEYRVDFRGRSYYWTPSVEHWIKDGHPETPDILCGENGYTPDGRCVQVSRGDDQPAVEWGIYRTRVKGAMFVFRSPEAQYVQEVTPYCFRDVEYWAADF